MDFPTQTAAKDGMRTGAQVGGTFGSNGRVESGSRWLCGDAGLKIRMEMRHNECISETPSRSRHSLAEREHTVSALIREPEASLKMNDTSVRFDQHPLPQSHCRQNWVLHKTCKQTCNEIERNARVQQGGCRVRGETAARGGMWWWRELPI